MRIYCCCNSVLVYTYFSSFLSFGCTSTSSNFKKYNPRVESFGFFIFESLGCAMEELGH